MGLWEIIAFLIALPAIIIGAIVLIVNWWVEGTITNAFLSAFDVGPIIGVLFAIIGIIVLFIGLSRLFN